jgi:hypothetical protein
MISTYHKYVQMYPCTWLLYLCVYVHTYAVSHEVMKRFTPLIPWLILIIKITRTLGCRCFTNKKKKLFHKTRTIKPVSQGGDAKYLNLLRCYVVSTGILTSPFTSVARLLLKRRYIRKVLRPATSAQVFSWFPCVCL